MKGTWLICEWCGDSFQQRGTRGPAPKYCSPAHRQRAYEARHLKEAIDEAVQRALEGSSG